MGYDGVIIIGTEIDTSYEAQIDKLADDLDRLQQEYEVLSNASPYENQEEDLKELAVEIEKVKNKLNGLKKKEEEVNNPKGSGQWLSAINSQLSSTIKKVGKWGLAIFGVRAAYGAIRQAISICSQYNEEMANKIESIKYTLSMAIMPIIEKIVGWVYTLVQYLQYIIKAWTGYDIFENAQKGAKATNKAAKELKKTLAGFDTANVLSDTSSSSTSTSSSTPSAMTGLDETEIPSWVKWIADNKDKVIAVAKELTALFLLAKTAEVINGFSNISSSIGSIAKLLSPLLGNVLKPLLTIVTNLFTKLGGLSGIASKCIIIYAVVRLIPEMFKEWNKQVKRIIDFFKDPSWGKFRDLLGGLVKLSFVNIKTAFKDILKLAQKIAKALGFESVFKGAVNWCIKYLNKFIDWINTKMKITIPKNKFTEYIGVNGTHQIVKISKIPELASGGIVNNPGRGVPIGNAIAGEAGAEAVIPLTDDTLRRLANMIPITIDLTNKLDSRTISKQLVSISNEKSFARNGG